MLWGKNSDPFFCLENVRESNFPQVSHFGNLRDDEHLCIKVLSLVVARAQVDDGKVVQEMRSKDAVTKKSRDL